MDESPLIRNGEDDKVCSCVFFSPFYTLVGGVRGPSAAHCSDALAVRDYFCIVRIFLRSNVGVYLR